MPVEIRVKGADQYAALARDLRQVANRGLKKEAMSALRKAARPLAKDAAPKAAREGLPKGGGLNEYVASAKFGVRTRTAGGGVGVRIVGTKKGHDIRSMDAGSLRHPVYGHKVWVLQSIKPGWWTEGMSNSIVLAPVQKEVLLVLDSVVRRLAHG